MTILLDVLFDEIPYEKTIEKPIQNELLLTEGENLSVVLPDVNALLADKLTAFAPHTTGVPFQIGKELEIMKQLYDCGLLFESMTDYPDVKKTYDRAASAEMRYRGLNLTVSDVLRDTIGGCLCIASRGIPEGDYHYYKDGIARLRNHILSGKFSGETAGGFAARVLYLAAAMLTGQDEIIKIEDISAYTGRKIDIAKPKRFSYLRITDPAAYGYDAEAAILLKDTEFVL